MTELKPCPFCGVKPHIVEHEDDTGKYYVIVHSIDDAPKCPIAMYRDEMMGVFDYRSEDEAIAVWNKRA